MDDDATQDNYEQFVELFTRNEQALRTFTRTLVPGWHDADEIVQEVALVAWRKFDDFEIGTSFIKWVCMIARFKALSYRRKMARDKLSFNTELIEIMAEEATEECDQRQSEYEALEKCLSKLSDKQRRLVTIAYTPGIKVKEEAERAGVRPGTFYMRLNRIRASLFECINETISEEGETA